MLFCHSLLLQRAKCASLQEVHAKLRCLRVLRRTLRNADAYWRTRVDHQRREVERIRKEEQRLAGKHDERNKPSTVRRQGFFPKPAGTHATPLMPRRLVTRPAAPARDDRRYRAFYNVAFDQMRVASPQISREEWDVVAAAEWAMKSQRERDAFVENV